MKELLDEAFLSSPPLLVSGPSIHPAASRLRLGVRLLFGPTGRERERERERESRNKQKQNVRYKLRIGVVGEASGFRE